MRKYNPYSLPQWLRQVRGLCAQFIIPICVFQGIRTIFLPTTFDVLILAVCIVLALSFHLEWI